MISVGILINTLKNVEAISGKLVVKVTLYYGETKAFKKYQNHSIPFVWKTNYANQGAEYDSFDWKQRTVFKSFQAQADAIALFEVLNETVCISNPVNRGSESRGSDSFVLGCCKVIH